MQTGQLQPAFVLHRSRYRDTSLLVELLTRDNGRLAAVARGAMGKRSDRSGLLQSFRPLLIDYRGKGEVGSLGKIEAANKGFLLTGKNLYCGLYLNELILRLTRRNDSHPAVFAAYTTTLAELSIASRPDRPLRFFEVQLLKSLGYALQLCTEAGGERPVEKLSRYTYRIGKGPVLSERAENTISGETLLRLAHNEELDENCRNEARYLMRLVLNYYLDGRPLRSRELFQLNPNSK